MRGLNTEVSSERFPAGTTGLLRTDTRTIVEDDWRLCFGRSCGRAVLVARKTYVPIQASQCLACREQLPKSADLISYGSRDLTSNAAGLGRN